MTERRYGEEEVREIFARASRAGEETSLVPVHERDRGDEGLTLEALQAIGGEAGLSPDRVARAAAALNADPEIVPRRRLLGLPTTAGRIVDLPREATAREWQFLVSELRTTFDAKGEVRAEGGIREWSNGNLHAVLEQTKDGHRLRLGTAKREETVGMIIMGATGLGMAGFLSIVLIADGKAGAPMIMPAMFGLGGVAALVAAALRLPRWASERERQMEHIAAWTRDLLSAPPKED